MQCGAVLMQSSFTQIPTEDHMQNCAMLDHDIMVPDYVIPVICIVYQKELCCHRNGIYILDMKSRLHKLHKIHLYH